MHGLINVIQEWKYRYVVKKKIYKDTFLTPLDTLTD